MPNYRNKNRNKNKNKQRNKQQQQQNQQQQQQTQQTTNNCKKDSEEILSSSSPIPPTGQESKTPLSPSPPPPPFTAPLASFASAIDLEGNFHLNENVDNCNNELLGATKNVQSLKVEADVTSVDTSTSDTVSNELPKCDNNENTHGITANDDNNMGNEKSKIKENLSEISLEQEEVATKQSDTAAASAVVVTPSPCAQGKVVVHRIICEDLPNKATNVDNQTETSADYSQQTTKELATHTKTVTTTKKATRSETKTLEAPTKFNETADSSTKSSPKQVKVIIHKIVTPDEEIKEKIFEEAALIDKSNTTSEDDTKSCVELPTQKNSSTNEEVNQKEVKVIIHKIASPEEDKAEVSTENSAKSELPIKPEESSPPSEDNNQDQVKVIVHRIHLENEHENPLVTSPVMREPITSTSQVKIVEMEMDECLSDLEELKSPVISEAESSLEYYDDGLQQSDSITEISSTSSQQKQSRKQKRIALENHFLPQMLNPRFLDSISEENSELSDNTENPLSRSASADSTNHISDAKTNKLNAVFPRSALDFSKTHKHHFSHLNSKVIREEPLAMSVSASFQDANDADESCTTLRSCMSPEAEAAEVVFINSASSSMSDLHDIDLMEANDSSSIQFDLDTDLKDLINKPSTETICFQTLTSSPLNENETTATTEQQQQQLPEFAKNENNNNQIINNSKLVNNDSQTSFTPISPTSSSSSPSSLPSTSATTIPLAVDETVLNTSSPANAQLVFAQIEEQISSALSSINEAISQNNKTTTTTASTATTICSHLSNTQNWPVTTKSHTTRMLETSCESLNTKSSLRADNNAKPPPQVLSENVKMNTVRDLINNNNNDAMNLNGNNNINNTLSATNGHMETLYIMAENNNKTNPAPPLRGSPPPPPIPPPPHSLDEYDNGTSLSSNLIPLLQKNVAIHNTQTQQHSLSDTQHDFPTQSLTTALGSLSTTLARQESMDSHCSDSTNFSQCTAINVAPDLSSSDIVQLSSFSDLKLNATQQQQQPQYKDEDNSLSPIDPKKLRLLCAETVAALPYGDEVLEELATLSQNIGEARAANLVKTEGKMPYPLPELPHIDDLQLSLQVGPSYTTPPARPAPPQGDQSWLGVPTNQDPKVLVCLSPSQRSYIQQKPEQRPDDLLDAHQKFVERRGYHEYSKEQLQILEKEKLAEQQLLQTAAVMKKLRKSITPPPPQIPPPPVPVKSSKTASKAQNLSNKRTNNANILTHTVTTAINNDVNLTNDNEQQQKQTASISGEQHNGEENKHRLLSIIQDTGESHETAAATANNKQTLEHHSSSSSSFENNSRQSNPNQSSSINTPAKPQIPLAETLTNGTSKTTNQFPHETDSKKTGNMQSVEATLGQMFPTMGAGNIFDDKHKRFSNIESFSRDPFTASQIMETQPKRYSSVETHYYETKKRMENGKVVEDYSTSKHETQNSGDKSAEDDSKTSSMTTFPLKPFVSTDSIKNSFLSPSVSYGDFNSQTKDVQQHDLKTNTDDQEIMSALNLNKHSADTKKTQTETTIKTTTTESAQSTTADDQNKEQKSIKKDEKDFVKNHLENTILKRGIQDTYEEFRQRAKAAANANSTLPTLNTAATAPTAKVASIGENGEMISSSTSSTITTKKTTSLNPDHEKLFKEFDDLSKQLHRELESSKAEREQRDKSASMFDLNRVQLRQRDQIEEFNKSRHDHMKELEQQIERSMRSRSMKFTRPSSVNDVVDYQYGGRTYEIPIQMENGYTSKTPHTNEQAPPVPEPPRTYQIPVQIENSSDSTYADDTRFRRAESMFNLGDDRQVRRERTYSNQQHQKAEDDWSKYASDLGSSENISRPLAKEVEICYQRRPGGIRAPRISASTNDLSYGSNNQTYDQYNAYNVRRSHAPMLNRAPQHSRPQFGSCYSMIERDPNPKYISTTSRRGASPAPQTSGFFPLDGCHVNEEDMRQRRASLPRELHEQQLKYILSKEEELRTEFERLQNERRRLMEEAHKAQVMQMPQQPTSPMTPTRPLRDPYRSTQKLPTLTEDEVFRQQMAEEWLNKVAEREKRRLQNIIKISKITDDDALATHKANMEEEFLSRVKERRCKLAMPADSDWESGAESHPNNQTQLSESEEVPPMKIIEGKAEANLRRLPPHLREFAKFSNHQREAIDGGHREQHQEEESSHETTDNSVSKAFKKSTVVKTVKTLRAPMMTEQSGGHDNKLHYHKPKAYQIPIRTRDKQSSDQNHRKNPCETRRPIKQTRFAVPVPATNRRSWSESDLLEEINKELNLAKGFLFQDEKAQSPSMFAPKFKAKAPTGTGIWTPRTQTPTSSWSNLSEQSKSTPPTPPPPPVWTPQPSPQSDRKEFRPVHFESPTLSRRKYVISNSNEPTLPPWNNQQKSDQQRSRHPQSCTNLSSDTPDNHCHLDSSSDFVSTGLPKSSISDKIKTFERSASASDLYTRPQIIRLADKGRPLCKPNEVIYNVKHEYMSEPETDNERPRKMAQLGRRQYDGIGPITNDGMPIILRSEVKEPHQHEWYKRLYQTIHKQKHGGRNQYTKPNGYQSEPEPNYDSDYSTIKYRSINPNRLQSSVSSALNVRNSNDTLYGTLPHPVKSVQNSYKNQPGRIEDYTTGHSSVSEKEKKEQFDQAKLSSHYTEGNLSRALAKESGYTSDSNLVFRKKEIPPLSSPLSPVEQKQAYKSVQAGGEPPRFGFRKPAPEKSKALDATKETNIPPAPPNRKSLYTKSMSKISSKGLPIPSSSASRHEKCFKMPESPVLGQPNKYGTITLRKSSKRAPLCRSKSAGAVQALQNRLTTAPSLEQRVTVLRKQNKVRSSSPLRRPAAQLAAARHCSRSPVAFGRSISKERSFAEEKKRLETSLPLSRYTFEASTNILRDPSLKSPQDVKQAVRTLAACAVQTRSRSVPRFCSGCRSQAHLDASSYASRHSLCFPEIEHYGYTEWLRSPMQVSTTERRRTVEKSQSAKHLAKVNSNVSLAGSNSTFSLGQSPTISPSTKTVEPKTPPKTLTVSKICKKLAKENLKAKKVALPKRDETIKEKPQEKSHEISSYVCQQKFTPNVRAASIPRPEDLKQQKMFEESREAYVSSVRDRTLFWNDFNLQQTTSLPYTGSKHSLPSYTANISSGHKSRSLSPKRNRLHSEESNQTLAGDSGYIDAMEFGLSEDSKEFSPTREIRVPPSSSTRNLRSPSRRKIDSCRSNQTHNVIRASSLSSAEDRSKRGLYLCDELAHSATSLASNDRHSPTCRYLHNSERFVELNRFYHTLERVGQLEKATSKPHFKPIRKESDLLDYEEWRKVRLHERAEKELNFLVTKLKQEQQEQKFLFLPKDVSDVKWKKEYDVGLNSREKSVEDLRENFENINFLQDYIDQRNQPCCNMKYWRRNTVADLTHSLETKLQEDELNREDTSPTRETHFSEQLVNTLPNDQIKKINQQLNEIYAYEQNKPLQNDEKYVMTVEHNTMPSSSQALRVRCKSSITRDELLGSILKKRDALSNITLKNPDHNLKKAEEVDSQKPPEIPPAPKMDSTVEYTVEPSPTVKNPKDICQKIQYFEERKYDNPPKTVYHAREDSSPDEDEVMRLIEEKMRLKQYRGYHQHKELSTSLTDLCDLFGEKKNTSKVNFHLLSPQQRPPDEYQEDISEIYQQSDEYSPYSSLEFLETYCRSRSVSPQSQCSSYLQRVNTGDVQKIREKFESLGYNSLKSNHFFGLRKLRKVRSDPEMCSNKSESKDAYKNGEVSWITHKFEIQNKLLKPAKEEPAVESKRSRKRQVVSPTPMTSRLMPHIDRISKTAILGNLQNKTERPKSPIRSLSSNSGTVERLKLRYDSQQCQGLRREFSSLSSPDISGLRDNIPQYLTGNWIAHRYPSPTHNQINEHKPRLKTTSKNKRSTPKPKASTTNHSSHKPKSSTTTKCRQHSKSKDIFANQKFDPKIHTPKARYVPDGAETKKMPRLQWSPLTPKKVNAVTFQDYDYPSPQLPPPPKGELLQQGAVSPNHYYESDVNIHFKTPVRQEFKYPISEEELAIRQAEQMQKLYQEERRRKYLQELQDMNSRRHTDNFTQSQKSPIPLNRYDDFPADLAPKTTNQIKSIARALYNFQAQNSKELSFKKGDIIYVKRAIDKNWYEGEHNAMIGLFPSNYVEIINEPVQPVQPQQTTHRKPSEGQARAKYNFQAQSGVELSLNKGELVALTRRVDDNWFEGRIANRKGIFPVAYVEVLTDIGAEDIASRTTTIQQASVVNARPSLDALRTNINNEFNTLTRNGNQPPNAILRETRNGLKTDILHVDTSSEPLVYRALYKYRPQNSDELELQESDLVHVLEKCDDGWYVGTSQRTGCFGTFPGNYVERI